MYEMAMKSEKGVQDPFMRCSARVKDNRLVLQCWYIPDQRADICLLASQYHWSDDEEDFGLQLLGL